MAPVAAVVRPAAAAAAASDPIVRSTIHSNHAKSRAASPGSFASGDGKVSLDIKSLLDMEQHEAVGGRDDPVPLSERKEILALSRCCLADSCELRLVASGAR